MAPDEPLFWASFSGGDETEPVVVRYEIPGHGSGFYTRYRGDRVTALFRYDGGGTGFPRGAVLIAGGRWQPSESPDRNVMRGSDYGEPISRAEAERIAAEFGCPIDERTAESGSKRPQF